MIVFYFFYKPKHADTNLKLAPCPVRSVAAATFAFYLADPISSIHEFAPIETRIYTKRFSSCFYLLKFVTIRAIRVTAGPLRTSGADLQKISELWPPLPLVVLYENLLLVESKSRPITSALGRRGNVHPRTFTPEKFRQSCAVVAGFHRHPARARLLCAFADGAGTAIATAGRRLSQRQHRVGSGCAL